MKVQPSILFLLLLLPAFVYGADYRVERLKEAPPAKELSKEIAGQLANEGFRVVRGSDTTYCDIWLCKQWDVKEGFSPSLEIIYPFKPGQLIGVIRFQRDSSDFRDQELDRGVYTMRYALQPVDGAHVGTSATRDFLLVVQAEDDKSADQIDQEELNERSAEAIGSTHPGLIALQPRSGSGEYPSIRHNDAFDWWIVGLPGMSKGDDGKPLPIEFVISGHAIE